VCNRKLTATVLAVLACSCVLLESCGHAEKEAAGLEIAKGFYAAVSDRDWERAAALFDPATGTTATDLQAALERNGRVQSISYFVSSSLQDHRTTPASWRVTIRATVSYRSLERVESVVVHSGDGMHFTILEYHPVTRWAR